MNKNSFLIIPLALLILLSSCKSMQDSSVFNVSSIEQTSVQTKKAQITNTETTIYLTNEPYSFSEVNLIFGPDSLSVNELSEIFGAPSFVYGYYYEKNYVISVTFQDVKFDLAANHGEKVAPASIKA